MVFSNIIVKLDYLEKMKKTYLEPEIKWLEPFDFETLMQNVSMDINDSSDDEYVEDFSNLLSKPANSVWDD